MGDDPRRAVAVILGIAIPSVLWLALVPWDLSGADEAGPGLTRIGIVILLTAVACGAAAFIDRTAGRYFVLTALVTSLLLFMRAAVTAEDPLWAFSALVFLLVTLAAFVLAFSVGRLLRTGSTTG